jgi:hypothetical protein
MAHANQLRPVGLVTAVALLVLLSSSCAARPSSSNSNYYIFPVDVQHGAIRTHGRNLLDAGKLDIDGRWGPSIFSPRAAPARGSTLDACPSFGQTNERSSTPACCSCCACSVRIGYFYAVLPLGTPPRQFHAIVDTGSTVTYVPCHDCRHCGTHNSAPFNPSQSPTAKYLSCKDPQCSRQVRYKKHVHTVT